MQEKVTGVFLIRKKDGAVLLQLRDKKSYIKYPNTWGTLGGHLIKNESYKKCAERELFEETGYKTKKLIFFFSFKQKNRKNITNIKMYYDFYDDKQKINCYEGQKIKFIKREQIKKYKIRKIIVNVWDLLLKKIK
jgi:8-oxo-dGTP pyrophosphatase MutT (NUDIX family)